MMRQKGSVMTRTILMESQINYIDKLLVGDNSIKDYEVPSLLYLIDNRFYPIKTITNLAFEQNSIKSDIAKQNLIYSINDYVFTQELFIPNEKDYGNFITSELIKLSIPSFDFSIINYQDMSSIEQILRASDTIYYSNEEILNVKKCLQSPYIKSRLKSNKVILKREIQLANTFISTIQKNEHEIINYYPDVLKYETVGIIGTSLTDGWEKSFPMQKRPNTTGIWEVSVELKEGHVKFRVNNNWTISWGGNSFPYGECIPHGTNIPVREGKYHVILNLKTQEYSFDIIEN
jgi:hypothetical protein